MQANVIQLGRVRRTVNDLVMAEMFLVQATIESAAVIGSGISELGEKISNSDERANSPWDSVSTVLQRIAGEALEPYTSRFKYLRNMDNAED